MHSKLVSFINKKIVSLLFIVVCVLFSTKNEAQCAGEDAAITICDYANTANQNINLFALLNGTPTAGGTWTDPLQTGALNATTGILNVWNIHISGIYTFKYTVNNIPGCTDNFSIITLTLGGYSGSTSPNASACSDDEFVNLFQFFDGSSPNPHLNGYWTDDSNTGALMGSNFNAKLAGIGVYSFTYTMPAVGTCPAVSSTAIVTVYRLPFPGIPVKILICDNIDFSLLSNLNLADFLPGADPGGQWSEGVPTMEISEPFDSYIDLQNVYNTFGVGSYGFVYTVFPNNPVCLKKQAGVLFVIEHLLDFTGNTFTVNSDICENEIGTVTYTAVLTQGFLPIPDGTYKVEYTITGHVGIITATAVFLNGVLSFPINPNFFPAVGSYTVNIEDIYDVTSERACQNIIDASDDLTIFPLPKINAATLTINPVCQNSDILISFSGISNLTDGDYEITYNLSGSNTQTPQIITVTVVNGLFSFPILASIVPNAGNTTIKITHIKNLQTGCENNSTLLKVFVIKGLPNVANFTATINDTCKNLPVSVLLSGLNSLGAITINYDLSGANTLINQTLVLNVNSGNVSFILPASQIPNLGLTTFTIINLINNVSLCGVSVSNTADTFMINDIPNPPIASDMEFCKTENATVSSLIPNGSQYNWYSSSNATTPLNSSVLLTTRNYYLSEANGTTGCNSERTMILVTINSQVAPILNSDGQNFCGVTKPTLQNLTANATANEQIQWFDNASGTNLLPNTQLLQDGYTYYGFGFSNSTNCLSELYLEVTVSLLKCDGENYDFFIPDGFSPNGDSDNDTFRIPGIEFIYPDYFLEIYNRYGNLLFTGNKNKPQWDGKNTTANSIDGIAPNGIYFYILTFNKNNKAPKQGRLYLNR